MSKPTTELILITGFLSSGKTTFLQEGIEGLEQSNAAIVINEQGQFKASVGFCNQSSVMGSSFLTTIDSMLGRHYDYILAETSGLAQPWVLNQLVNDAEQRNLGKLRFRGMICVIDGLRFLKLFSSVVSMYEQAAYADCFVLTKTDLANSEDLIRIKNILRMIRPMAPVFIREKTLFSFKTILSRMCGTSLGFEASQKSSEKKSFKNIGKKPKSTTLIPETPVSREHLEIFLTKMAPKTFISGLP
ncbi:MAG: hypothetical protein LBD29_11220 [Treponema sp.]|jgi:G3E family GTPase|nr:hypothetical protein [Treponema sp.]